MKYQRVHAIIVRLIPVNILIYSNKALSSAFQIHYLKLAKVENKELLIFIIIGILNNKLKIRINMKNFITKINQIFMGHFLYGKR